MASHRRSARSGLTRAARVTALSAATAAAVTAGVPAGAQPRQPEGGQDGAGGVRSRVEDLYAQAERATEAYDAAQERAARLRGRIETLQAELARTQEAVNRLRDGLGTVAATQYRDGGVDPALALLFTSDPDDYLDRAALLDRVGDRRAARMRQLHSAERALRQRRDEATAVLAELDRTRAALATHKRTVQSRLGQARRIVEALPPARRAAAGLGPAATPRPAAVNPLPGLPGLGSVSGRATEAVAAVRAALGSPYAWGGSGPTAFDCSGLMYWAYQRAGVALPRTSQEQMSAGRRVPLDQARPGDLVIYRSDASHVGMYVGDGQVVHAPYPGARVRSDPVTMMPVAAVVRP